MELITPLVDILTDKSVIFALANTIYCVSYILTSMVWLRFLAVVGAASTLPYFFLQPEPLYQALFWQSMFLLINLVNLVVLLISMRTPRLNDQQKSLLKNVFTDLKPHELVPLLKAADSLNLSAGETLLKAGQKNDSLYLLIDGRVSVEKDGGEIAVLESNSFIGEMSFISGAAASATVTAAQDTVVYVWGPKKLDKLFRKQSLYRMYFYQLCGVDMAGKLRSMKAENSIQTA